MVLQEVIIDPNENESLYFRIKGKSINRDGKIILQKDAEFRTDTYYNSFSKGKWMKYCDVNAIKLHVLFEGKAAFKIIYAELTDDCKLTGRAVFSEELNADGKTEKIIELPGGSESSIYFTIKALTDKTVLYGAWYEAQCQEREIRLAFNICTYKREINVLRNLELIRKNFTENSQSLLNGRLEIFVIDNGGTLDEKGLSTKNIHVVHNPNAGGAGGFSRGLWEILKIKEEKQITNVIFMDDDIEFEAETVLRTYRMLCVLKKEYRGAFIAGAMLLQNLGYIQYENAAVWNGGKRASINRGLDLRNYRNVVYNEIEKKSEYAAWWYCCIPADIVSENNMAVPVFIHADDIEYSLRNASAIITLNGVAVRHMAIEQKVTSANTYYDMRNMLIVNSRYYPDKSVRSIKMDIFRLMLSALLHYRYKDVKMLYRAVADYAKGPEWLMDLDAVEYHKKLLDEGYKPEDVSGILHKKVPAYANENHLTTDFFAKDQKSGKYWKLIKTVFYALTFNGWFFPSKGKCAFIMNVSPARLYRRHQIILYDDQSMQGVSLKKENRQIVAMLKLYGRACLILDRRYHSVRAEYEKKWKELHGSKYWGKFWPEIKNGWED